MKKLIQILVYISFLLLSNRMIAINPENLSGSLTGKITDKKTGDLMPGVNVYFPDLKTGTISDKDGIYMIDNLPKTKVLVQVSFLGYKTILEKIDLGLTSTTDFAMEQSAVELNEVVVTGSSSATNVKHSSVPIASIGSKRPPITGTNTMGMYTVRHLMKPMQMFMLALTEIGAIRGLIFLFLMICRKCQMEAGILLQGNLRGKSQKQIPSDLLLRMQN